MNRHVVRPTGNRAETRRGGFTLLELMVSMIIIAIIVATVMPAVSKSMAAGRVQQASTVIATNIQRAFSLAAQKRSPMRISIDTAGKKIYVKNRARDSTYVTAEYNSSSEIGLTRLQSTDTTIIVYPNGLANTAFTITVYSGTANKRQIAATRAGQIRITTP